MTGYGNLKPLSLLKEVSLKKYYAAFVSGFKRKFTYISHTEVIPGISDLLDPIDDLIDTQFILAITDGHYCSPGERSLAI